MLMPHSHTPGLHSVGTRAAPRCAGFFVPWGVFCASPSPGTTLFLQARCAFGISARVRSKWSAVLTSQTWYASTAPFRWRQAGSITWLDRCGRWPAHQMANDHLSSLVNEPACRQRHGGVLAYQRRGVRTADHLLGSLAEMPNAHLAWRNAQSRQTMESVASILEGPCIW